MLLNLKISTNFNEEEDESEGIYLIGRPDFYNFLFPSMPCFEWWYIIIEDLRFIADVNHFLH